MIMIKASGTISVIIANYGVIKANATNLQYLKPKKRNI